MRHIVTLSMITTQYTLSVGVGELSTLVCTLRLAIKRYAQLQREHRATLGCISLGYTWHLRELARAHRALRRLS